MILDHIAELFLGDLMEAYIHDLWYSLQGGIFPHEKDVGHFL